VAATPEQFIEQLKALQKALQTEGLKIAQKMALTGKSLVQERIQREGLPGEQYSTNEMPTFLWEDQVRNAGGTKYLEDNSSGTWGNFRKAQGLNSSFVDLTYSGRMFNGLRPIKKFATGTTFEVHMGGTDQEVDNKLMWNIERYGDFLQPNQEEQKEIDEIVDDEVGNLIDKYLR